MGGGYYDRDVGVVDSSSSYDNTNINSIVSSSSMYNNPGFSSTAAKVVGKTTRLQKELDPAKFSETKQKCNSKSPLVFALDVTSSMGDWTKVNNNDIDNLCKTYKFNVNQLTIV